MVADDLLDLQESYLPMWMRGLRCIACGNIVDPLINRHRMIQQSGTTRMLKPEVRTPVLSRPAKAA
jgi:hypothetical protein